MCHKQPLLSVSQLIRELGNINVKKKEPPFCYPYSLKARVLVLAHLARMDVSEELEEGRTLQFEIILIMFYYPMKYCNFCSKSHSKSRFCHDLLAVMSVTTQWVSFSKATQWSGTGSLWFQIWEIKHPHTLFGVKLWSHKISLWIYNSCLHSYTEVMLHTQLGQAV